MSWKRNGNHDGGYSLGLQQKNASSHFLSLQCVLDKYQHENNILSKRVDFLISQNKRLQEKAVPLLTSSNRNDLSAKAKYQHEDFNKNRFRLQLDKQKIEAQIDKKTRNSGLGFDQKYEKFNKRNIYMEQKCSPRALDSSRDFSTGRTEKKYCYLSKAKEILQSRVQQARKDSPRYSYTQAERPRIQDQKTQRQKAQSPRLKTEPEVPLSHQRKKIFNRQVYLERETVLIEDESPEKLPTFIEASFGNAEQVEQKNHQRKRPKNSKPLVDSNFKLGRTEIEKKQFSNKIVKVETFGQTPEEEKENIEKLGGKKTNYPYIKQDYKLAEPKTQLTRILRPERNTWQREQGEAQRGRKTFLNVISKTGKKSLFSK